MLFCKDTTSKQVNQKQKSVQLTGPGGPDPDLLFGLPNPDAGVPKDFGIVVKGLFAQECGPIAEHLEIAGDQGPVKQSFFMEVSGNDIFLQQ